MSDLPFCPRCQHYHRREPLTDEDWECLANHLGYGNPDGRLWFLGMEERLERADLRDCDLRFRVDNLSHPIGTLEHLRDGELPATPTWRMMARLKRLLLDGISSWDDRGGVRDEILCNRLGPADGETFLLDLLPYPDVGLGYFSHDDRYADRSAYRKAILSRRVALIRNALETHGPRLVIAYGKTCWEEFKKLLLPNTFREHPTYVPVRGKPNVFRAIPMEIARTSSGIMLLTPFFRSDQIPNSALSAFPEILEEEGLWPLPV